MKVNWNYNGKQLIAAGILIENKCGYDLRPYIFRGTLKIRNDKGVDTAQFIYSWICVYKNHMKGEKDFQLFSFLWSK